jgi:protein TonB
LAAAVLLALPAEAQQPAVQDAGERGQKPSVESRGVVALMIDYPPAALSKRQEGPVKMSMCVDKNGRPRDVKLVESSGSQALDEASLKGAASLRFKPGTDAWGKPVDWCDPPYVMTINWRLPPR